MSIDIFNDKQFNLSAATENGANLRGIENHLQTNINYDKVDEVAKNEGITPLQALYKYRNQITATARRGVNLDDDDDETLKSDLYSAVNSAAQNGKQAWTNETLATADAAQKRLGSTNFFKITAAAKINAGRNDLLNDYEKSLITPEFDAKKIAAETTARPNLSHKYAVTKEKAENVNSNFLSLFTDNTDAAKKVRATLAQNAAADGYAVAFDDENPDFIYIRKINSPVIEWQKLDLTQDFSDKAQNFIKDNKYSLGTAAATLIAAGKKIPIAPAAAAFYGIDAAANFADRYSQQRDIGDNDITKAAKNAVIDTLSGGITGAIIGKLFNFAREGNVKLPKFDSAKIPVYENIHNWRNGNPGGAAAFGVNNFKENIAETKAPFLRSETAAKTNADTIDTLIRGDANIQKPALNDFENAISKLTSENAAARANSQKIAEAVADIGENLNSQVTGADDLAQLFRQRKAEIQKSYNDLADAAAAAGYESFKSREFGAELSGLIRELNSGVYEETTKNALKEFANKYLTRTITDQGVTITSKALTPKEIINMRRDLNELLMNREIRNRDDYKLIKNNLRTIVDNFENEFLERGNRAFNTPGARFKTDDGRIVSGEEAKEIFRKDWNLQRENSRNFYALADEAKLWKALSNGANGENPVKDAINEALRNRNGDYLNGLLTKMAAANPDLAAKFENAILKTLIEKNSEKIEGLEKGILNGKALKADIDALGLNFKTESAARILENIEKFNKFYGNGAKFAKSIRREQSEGKPQLAVNPLGILNRVIGQNAWHSILSTLTPNSLVFRAGKLLNINLEASVRREILRNALASLKDLRVIYGKGALKVETKEPQQFSKFTFNGRGDDNPRGGGNGGNNPTPPNSPKDAGGAAQNLIAGNSPKTPILPAPKWKNSYGNAAKFRETPRAETPADAAAQNLIAKIRGINTQNLAAAAEKIADVKATPAQKLAKTARTKKTAEPAKTEATEKPLDFATAKKIFDEAERKVIEADKAFKDYRAEYEAKHGTGSKLYNWQEANPEHPDISKYDALLAASREAREVAHEAQIAMFDAPKTPEFEVALTKIAAEGKKTKKAKTKTAQPAKTEATAKTAEPEKMEINGRIYEKVTDKEDFIANYDFTKNAVEIPQEVNVAEFLKSLESVENKENFIKHLQTRTDAQARLAYLNLIEPTLKEPDVILTQEGRSTKIKPFRDSGGKNIFEILVTQNGDKMLITSIQTPRENYLKNKIKNADLIQIFTGQASKGETPNGLTKKSVAENLKESQIFKNKNLKNYEDLIGFLEDNLQKRANSYQDWGGVPAFGGKSTPFAITGQREQRFEKEKIIADLDEFLKIKTAPREISEQAARDLAFKKEKLNAQELSDLFNYLKTHAGSKNLKESQIYCKLAAQIKDDLIAAYERDLSEIARAYGLKDYEKNVLDFEKFRYGDIKNNQRKDARGADFLRRLALDLNEMLKDSEPNIDLIKDYEFLIENIPHYKHLSESAYNRVIAAIGGMRAQEIQKVIQDENFMKKLDDLSDDEAVAAVKKESFERAKEDFRKEFFRDYEADEVIKDILARYNGDIPAARAKIEAALNIHPLAEFGTNYAEFYHDGENAVKKVLAEKQGQVAGAFYRDDLGDITLVWGEPGTGKSDGWGLSKIVKFHPEAVDKMNEIIQKGSFYKDDKGRPNIIYDDILVGLRNNWKGKETPYWIVSSYEKKNAVEPGKGIDTAESLKTSGVNYSSATHKSDISTNSQKEQIRPARMTAAEFDVKFDEINAEYNAAIKKVEDEAEEAIKNLPKRENTINVIKNLRAEIDAYYRPLNTQEQYDEVKRCEEAIKKVEQDMRDNPGYYFGNDLAYAKANLETAKDKIKNYDNEITFVRNGASAIRLNNVKNAADSIKMIEEYLQNNDKVSAEKKKRLEDVAAIIEKHLNAASTTETSKKAIEAARDKKIEELREEWGAKLAPIKRAYREEAVPQGLNLADDAKAALAFMKYTNERNNFKDKRIKNYVYEANHARAKIEAALNIHPLAEFGTNYAEFYHDGENAVKKVLAEKQGQVAGAFYSEKLAEKTGTGDIDLVWGNDKFGLKHILKKRTTEFGEEKALKIIGEIPTIIKNGNLIKQNEARYRIESGNYVIGLSAEYKGEKRNLIITTFERKENADTFSEPRFKSTSHNAADNLKKDNTKTAPKNQLREILKEFK